MNEAQLKQHYAEVRRRLTGGRQIAKEKPRDAAPAVPDWLRLSNFNACGVSGIYGNERFGTGLWFPSMALIQRAVCEHFGIGKVDLLSGRRTADLVVPRHIAIFLARTMTPLSYPAIGARMGKRDHTSCLYSYKRVVADIRKGDPVVCKAVAAIRAQFVVPQ